MKRNWLKFVLLFLLSSAGLATILLAVHTQRPCNGLCVERDTQDNVDCATIVAFDPYFNRVNQIQEFHFAQVLTQR